MSISMVPLTFYRALHNSCFSEYSLLVSKARPDYIQGLQEVHPLPPLAPIAIEHLSWVGAFPREQEWGELL